MGGLSLPGHFPFGYLELFDPGPDAAPIARTSGAMRVKTPKGVSFPISPANTE